MRNNPTQFKRVFETLMLFIFIGVVVFAFLSLCNWSYQIKEWTGFSRFLLGAVGIVFLIRLFDDL
jgi:hypothetical protein